MVIIYHANNSLDANMIKSLLAQASIPAYILGEHLQGGVGDLPASDLVKVAVDNNYETEAKQIIEAWNAASIVEEESTANLNLLDGDPNATA